jgi:hypothetical protein
MGDTPLRSCWAIALLLCVGGAAARPREPSRPPNQGALTPNARPLRRGVAVLVESRPLPTLRHVVDTARSVLDVARWDVLVVHGDDNAGVLRESYINSTREGVRLVHHLGDKTLTRHGYNALVKSRAFYEQVLPPSEPSNRSGDAYYSHVLFFQHDTVLCGVDSSAPIETFIEFAYVGAPWSPSVSPKGGFACACLRDKSLPRSRVRVGNGGLSLRRVDMTIRAIDRFFEFSGEMPYNEDVWFSCAADHFGMLPTVKIARDFAIESMPLKRQSSEDAATTPFGVHKPWAYLSESQLEALKNVCPPLSRLMELGGFKIPIGQHHADQPSSSDL